MAISKYVSDYLKNNRMKNGKVEFTGSAGSSYFNQIATTYTTPSEQKPPITICVKNTSSKVVENVRVCFAINGKFSKENNYGNDEAIELSASFLGSEGVIIGDSTYEKEVQKIYDDVTFCVGTSTIQAVKVQPQANIGIFVFAEEKDINDVSKGVPIVWLKDPYRNQSAVLVNNTPYHLRGGGIIIPKVLPNAEFYLFLYPAQNINPASPLMGQGIPFSGNPLLIRQLPTAKNNNEGV